MPYLITYLAMVQRAETVLADAFITVADGHQQEVDVFHVCTTLADMSRQHHQLLTEILDRRASTGAADEVEQPERLHAPGMAGVRKGGVGLLRDLQDLYLLATLVQTTWTVIYQAAQGARDRELIDAAEHCSAQTSRQLTWLNTRMKAAAPQALLVSS